MSLARYDRVKRIIDVVVAMTVVLATAPLQGVIAILVRRNLGAPVLFRQTRPGKDEQVFELIKFRTMRDPDPAAGLVTDADRLTPLGTKLRATSLDELPTLWNVLRGDMSIVGPRPLLVQYLERYDSTQRRRHEVRPGVTGLAQVSGRNSLSWEEKFFHDLWYVDNRSLRLDLNILKRTLRIVLGRAGVENAQGIPMPEFKGKAQGTSLSPLGGPTNPNRGKAG